jgi:predicted dehydrogenase
MKLGLIGTIMHWQTYGPALKTVPGLELVAVAPDGPADTLGAFDHAPGLTVRTKRYEDAQRMLDAEKLDVVQVCPRPDRVSHWVEAALRRGIPVLAEKPLAMDLAALRRLYDLAVKTGTPLLPMHTMRGDPSLAAAAAAVRRGDIGEPLLGFSQKTYKWGARRADWHRTRKTFPGATAFIGIHALDWLHWMLGDVFTEVHGVQSASAHPDFPGTASHSAFTLRMRNGGSVALTVDYLRPMAAPTHGDERVRIAGTTGVVEVAVVEKRVTLTTDRQPPRALATPDVPDIFTAFARSLRGEGPPVMSLADAFRITEVALKAQQAADLGRTVQVTDSPYRPT